MRRQRDLIATATRVSNGPPGNRAVVNQPRPAAALRVGCSGWCYRDWRGPVYPAGMPQRCWFEHYQTLFDTVELNSTFYRLPTPDAADRWAHEARPGFLYAVKMGAFGSHRKKLRDAATWLPNHLDRAERLDPVDPGRPVPTSEHGGQRRAFGRSGEVDVP